MDRSEAAEETRQRLLAALEDALRVNYLLDGSQYELDIFRSKVLPDLSFLVLAFEYAIRLQTIAARRPDPPVLTLSAETMRGLFLLDLKTALESAGLSDGTAEDAIIILNELGDDICAYLAAFEVDVRTNTLLRIGLESEPIIADEMSAVALEMLDYGSENITFLSLK